MRRRTIAVSIAATAIAATAIAGGAVAVASSDDGDETVTGTNADKAAAAAVAETGGKLSGVEREDDGSGVGWEVEITKDDGSEIEVHVDQDYKVISVESDDESGTEADDD